MPQKHKLMHLPRKKTDVRLVMTAALQVFTGLTILKPMEVVVSLMKISAARILFHQVTDVGKLQLHGQVHMAAEHSRVLHAHLQHHMASFLQHLMLTAENVAMTPIMVQLLSVVITVAMKFKVIASVATTLTANGAAIADNLKVPQLRDFLLCLRLEKACPLPHFKVT